MSSAGQEIPHILRTTEIHYRIQNSPTCVTVLSQIIPVHVPIKLLEDPFHYCSPI